jgi:hypothetical protein
MLGQRTAHHYRHGGHSFYGAGSDFSRITLKEVPRRVHLFFIFQRSHQALAHASKAE